MVFVSASLATITVDYRQGESGPLAGLGRQALAVMAPMQRAVTSVVRPVGDFLTGLAHLPSLEAENQRLREENASLRAEAGLITAVEADKQRLTDLLGVANTLQSSKPVAAQVIGNGPSNFEWTITIDRGSDDGIQLNDPVVAGPALGGAPLLVGHVIRVAPNASDVQLLIDRSSFVGSKLADSGATGLVQGQGQDDMQMTLVDPSVEAPLNELVVTSGYKIAGEQSLYPPGIVIGQVSRFVPATNDLQAFIMLRPAVDFSRLQYVLVLTRSGA
ncbi:MAG: rod shape-determining protein MreC [Actinobacteria bacterium]|nr:rod shape-determining protein MreC [Actinomycetota bacterium]